MVAVVLLHLMLVAEHRKVALAHKDLVLVQEICYRVLVLVVSMEVLKILVVLVVVHIEVVTSYRDLEVFYQCMGLLQVVVELGLQYAARALDLD